MQTTVEERRYLGRLAPSTRQTAGADLAVFAAATWPDSPPRWHDIRAKDITRGLAKVLGSTTPSVVRRMLSAVRGMLRELLRTRALSAQEYIDALDAAKIDVPWTAGEPRKMAHAADVDKVLAYLESQEGWRAVRDAAVFVLMTDEGFTRTTLPRLTLEEYRRLVPSRRTHKVVSRWIKIRGQWEGPLIATFIQHTPRPIPLSGQAIYLIVQQRAKEAGFRTSRPPASWEGVCR